MGIKNSETAVEWWKYKARIVAQGSVLKDVDNNQIYFQDCGNAPTSMAAIRSIWAYGHLSGGGCSTADAEQAYIQPRLPDDEIYFARIPQELQTPAMQLACKGMSDPVFRMRRPLYGLPRSGPIWDDFLHEKLVSLKWIPIENWPHCYYKLHHGKAVGLTVYVDDAVMGGPRHMELWPEIRKLILTTEPTPLTKVLGVHLSNAVDDKDPNLIHGYTEMTEFCRSSVKAYNAIPEAPTLRSGVDNPWVDASSADMNSPELAKPGVLAPNAASLLMKALYMARMARLDVCWTINTLARYVTKWTRLQDKQICRLYGYMACNSDLELHSVMHKSDLPDLCIDGYPDADHAGATDSAKSTSGNFTALYGPRGTFVQLEWSSKRQSATSHSTTEAEMISASKILRESVVPQQALWSILLQRPVKARIFEDNESTLAVIRSGYSPQLRHVAKHQRISVSIVHELCNHKDGDITASYIETSKQKGDLLTKGLDRSKHNAALELVGLQSPRSSTKG